MAQDDELEDNDNSLEDDFLSGDLLPNDIDDDVIIGGEGDTSDFAAGDDDDDIIDNDDPEDNEDEDSEDEEDEEGAEAKGKGGKDDPADDADGSETFLRATYWKEIGKLPADLEIPADIDDIKLEDLYLKQVEKNVINRIQTEIKDVIAAKGIDPNEIFGGEETEDEYYQKEYAKIASISYDTLVEKNDDVTAALKIIGTEYWISKSKGTLTEEDVEVNVANDLKKMDEEELYAKYQKHFAAESNRLTNKIKEDAKEKARQDEEQAKADAKYVRETLGDKYTPAQAEKLINALTKRDQIYDDGKGNRRVVTLFEKKRLEAGSNIKNQLTLAIQMILGTDEATIKEKSERIGTVNTLQKLAKASASMSGKTPDPKSKGQKKNSIKSREFEDMLLD